MTAELGRELLNAVLRWETHVRAPQRLCHAVDWHPETAWQPELNFTARSWERWSLFSVRPARGARPIERVRARERVDSPTGRFRYVERVLPAGVAIATYDGERLGTAMFDGDVVVPCLYELSRETSAPWMSLTPMEVLTLRQGTALAKGHTVVAGLGLGWQLAQVLARGATRVTLVERDQELVDWVLPRVLDAVAGHAVTAPIEVIVGDAYQVVPTLEADIALIDIYPRYGDNTFPACPNIERVWCWGR